REPDALPSRRREKPPKDAAAPHDPAVRRHDEARRERSPREIRLAAIENRPRNAVVGHRPIERSGLDPEDWRSEHGHPHGSKRERVRARVWKERVSGDRDRFAAKDRVEWRLVPDSAPTRQRRHEPGIAEEIVFSIGEIPDGGVIVLAARKG